MNLCQCGCGELIPCRSKNKGEPLKFKHGHNKGHWKGGRVVNSQGYILIYKPNHPFADIHKNVREHRLVWEKHNKAILLPWADIHHKNGIKIDNRIENLEVINHSEHTTLHIKENGYIINQFGTHALITN